MNVSVHDRALKVGEIYCYNHVWNAKVLVSLIFLQIVELKLVQTYTQPFPSSMGHIGHN